MIIIPAVDIKGGKCVRLRQGRADQETVFSDHPLEMALKWRQEGAARLHIIDLDGAFEKRPRNESIIREIVREADIPVQLGGGIRDLHTIQAYLSLGLSQVILGTVALKEPDLVKEACRLFPGRIMVSLDARDNRLAVEGWTEWSDRDPLDLVKPYQDWGVRAIIFTDIRRDGTQKGPAIRSTRRLIRSTNLPVIAAGGIATLKDIQRLAHLEAEGLAAVISGKALYSGSLDIAQALDWLKKNTLPFPDFP